MESDDVSGLRVVALRLWMITPAVRRRKDARLVLPLSVSGQVVETAQAHDAMTVHLGVHFPLKELGELQWALNVESHPS